MAMSRANMSQQIEKPGKVRKVMREFKEGTLHSGRRVNRLTVLQMSQPALNQIFNLSTLLMSGLWELPVKGWL